MITVPRLLGSYSPPRVQVGDRVYCEYRQTRCRVSSWTDSPISWPRVQPLGQHGGHGLLVTEELIRAIRTESASSLMYFFGAGSRAVWNWRREYLPTREKFGTPGSVKAHWLASKAGGFANKVRRWKPAERLAQSKRSKVARLAQHFAGRRWAVSGWKPWEEKLLATAATDAEIAAKTGRTVNAVRSKRRRCL